MIYFTRPEAQLPRLFATVRELMDARGIKDAPRHVFAYRFAPGAREGESRKSFVSFFIFKKTPFTDDELRRMEGEVLRPATPGDGDAEKTEILYSPLRSWSNP